MHLTFRFLRELAVAMIPALVVLFLPRSWRQPFAFLTGWCRYSLECLAKIFHLKGWLYFFGRKRTAWRCSLPALSQFSSETTNLSFRFCTMWFCFQADLRCFRSNWKISYILGHALNMALFPPVCDSYLKRNGAETSPHHCKFWFPFSSLTKLRVGLLFSTGQFFVFWSILSWLFRRWFFL